MPQSIQYTAASSFFDLSLSPIKDSRQLNLFDFIHQSPSNESVINEEVVANTSTPQNTLTDVDVNAQANEDFTHPSIPFEQFVDQDDCDVIDVKGATQIPGNQDFFPDSELEAFLEQLQNDDQFNLFQNQF